MSKIYPFRAMYFNPDVTPDFSEIISSPEFRADCINEIQDCMSISEYNICNLLEPLYFANIESKPQKYRKKRKREQKSTKFLIDNMKNKQYDEHFRNIAKKFAGWLETGKILRDETPAIYLYERDFWDERCKIMRKKRSILSLLSLENPEQGSIKSLYSPDKDAVEQAYRLMKITFSQFSPVIIGYSDPKNSVQTLLKQVIDEQPNIFAYDKDGFFHSIRVIHNEGIIDALQKIFNDFTLGIIDGAQNYVAAYQFMEEMKRLEHTGSGTETVGNVFVNLIALDNDEYTNFESVTKVLSKNDAKNFRLRDVSKQTILRLKESATQTLFRRNIHSDITTQSTKKNRETKSEINEKTELEDYEITDFEDSLEGVINPLALNYLQTWAREYFIVEEVDWELDFETVEREQKSLEFSVDSKQALLFIPSEGKLLRLKITHDETLKKLLTSKKISTSDKLDINLFWRNLLKKIYVGFDDDKHSMNIWNINNLHDFLGNKKNSESVIIEKSKLNGDIDDEDYSESEITSKNLKNTPNHLLTRDEITENLQNTGIFMIFKNPEVAEVLSLFSEDSFNMRQIYRLQNVLSVGLISYRLDLSETDDNDED
ncbi:MAG: DUF1015 domain-containing protein [Planctomycetes bacterium]|nr:DUF1015 domain-containing protein [Planctomycetota bacterium]